MEVLTTAASALNCMVDQSVFIVHFLLTLNHDLVSMMIHAFKYITDVFITFFYSICHIVYCYFADFIVFLDEFGAIILLIINLLTSIAFATISIVCEQLNLVINFVFSVYYGFHSLLSNVFTCISRIIHCIHYFFGLVISAFLLLLQFIPDSFILFLNFLIYLFNAVSNCAVSALFGVFNAVYIFRITFEEAILSIPPKAYVGLVILSMMYYVRSQILRYLSNFFSACTRILNYASSMMTEYAQRLIIASVVLSVYALIVVYDWICLLLRVPVAGISYVQTRRRMSTQGLHSSSRASVVSPTRLRINFNNMKTVISKARSRKRLFADGDSSSWDENISSLQAELIREKDRHLCIVCQDQEKNVILLPCRHLCLCEGCCAVLKNESRGCPLCREYIVDAISVFV